MPAASYPFPLSCGTPGSGTILLGYYGDANFVSTGFVADRLYAVPFFVQSPVTISHLVCENTATTDTGEKIRLGIYSSLASGLPGTLLAETGEITLDGSRAVRIGTLGSTVSINQYNKYFLAAVLNASSGYMGSGGPSTANAMSGISAVGFTPWNAGFTTFNTSTYYPGIYKTHTYGALPSSYGTPTASDNIPMLGAKVQ